MKRYLAYYECDNDLTQYLTIKIQAETIEQAHSEAISMRVDLSNAYAVELDLIDVEQIETK